ncbi:MAG: hypothetical protein AB1540_08270 [Bdellovibrionota bacterium]
MLFRNFVLLGLLGVSTVAFGAPVPCDQEPNTANYAKRAAAECKPEACKLHRLFNSNGKTVGFLKYRPNEKGIPQFSTLFLCSSNYRSVFYVDGTAEEPRGWVPSRVGNSRELPGIYEDEAEWKAKVTTLSRTKTRALVKVEYRVAELYEKKISDKGSFLVSFPRSWLKR